MNDNDLNETELTRVSNALDALEKHNNQPTTSAWEAIMEESNNRSRRMSRRTQLISAAAAAVVVIAITGAAIVVTSNGNNKTVKTVDKKKHENVSTSTTAPPTPEQKLLQDVYLGVATIEKSPSLGFDVVTNLEIRDGATNKSVYSVPNDMTDKEGQIDLNINRVSGPYLTTSRFTQCDTGLGFSTLEIKSGNVISNNDMHERVYSPNGEKYIEINPGCDSAESAFIVTSTSGNKRELKPETIDSQLVGITDAFWIDNGRFVYVLNDGGIPRIGDTAKNISFTNDQKIAAVGVDATLLDVRTFDSKTYTLTYNYESSTMYVYDLDSEQLLWSHELNLSQPNDFLRHLSFGNSPRRVVGSVADSSPTDAYIYDQESDTTLRPDAYIVLPKI